jgi:hypothetical protein
MKMGATLAYMNPIALIEATAAARNVVLGALATDPVVPRSSVLRRLRHEVEKTAGTARHDPGGEGCPVERSLNRRVMA